MVVSVPSVNLMGVPVNVVDCSQALNLIEMMVRDNTGGLVAFANAHMINTASSSDEYKALLSRHALVLNDGLGVSIAARMHNVRFPENLNGTDFTPRLLQMAADREWKVVFVGSADGVAARAAANLQKSIPGLNIVATLPGFMTPEQTDDGLTSLELLEPDLMVVGMGCPIQEFWLSNALPIVGAKAGVSVGAFFDFSAGEVDRAPAWMRSHGLEWTFRLAQEPKRLFRRYVIGNPTFLYRSVKWRILNPNR